MAAYLIESNESNLIANIQLPASKSISNRALILNKVYAQITGKSILLTNLSEAEDTKLMMAALDQTEATINVENAGTCLRFLSAYFAATPGCKITLTGNERMLQRPILPLVEALKNLGASISYVDQDGCLPISIEGTKLSGGTIEIDASQSSQFSSALMMIAPLMKDPLSIQLKGEIVSKNYLDLTHKMLGDFGFESTISSDHTSISVSQASKKIELDSYTIEADWSSAAFFYEAALLADKADILLEALSLNSVQGDVVLANYMNELGIRSLQKEKGVYLTKSKEYAGSNHSIDFTDCPDLAPAIVCATAGIFLPFTANGIGSLAFKESDRIDALANGLKKLNFKVESSKAELKHDGLQHSFYENKVIETHEDHRITMAFAMLAILQSNVVLSEIQSVQKSFPNFWIEAAKLGIKVRQTKAQKKEQH
ncbi:MAG: 3-phosphoshikimate 1-carboxyvinyltransferase [Bacteroidetes bacterium B1(2017)]|nr:MAG: 3-phosphoshikimate 1-carboxyvinyltransferase [Bacteroidetes bacterium B1(2017)]